VAPPGEAPGVDYLGDGKLFVGLWPKGLVFVPPDDVEPDGFLGMKFMWWRGSGVRGHLSIRGNEMTSGAAVRVNIPDYGLTGFQSTAIFFPTVGCYEIIGEADQAALTFVTLVRPCSALAELPLEERGRYAICA
jgi:hypothetical protein